MKHTICVLGENPSMSDEVSQNSTQDDVGGFVGGQYRPEELRDDMKNLKLNWKNHKQILEFKRLLGKEIL